MKCIDHYILVYKIMEDARAGNVHH